MAAGSTGWRTRLRHTRAGSLLLKGLVLVLGAVFILLGLALVVLPGPLTIPPMLLGLYIWSTEFAWAERLRMKAAVRSRAGWAATRRRPVHATVATVSGLLGLGVAIVAVRRYDVAHALMSAFG